MKNLIKTTMDKLVMKAMTQKAVAKRKLTEQRGDFVMDHAVVFVIILVIAGIGITLLTTFLQTDMAPLFTQKIKDFFN